MMMYKFLIKRAFEFTFALIALILLSPIFLMISIFILIKMGTPVLFKQSRPGLNNEIFELKQRIQRLETDMAHILQRHE